MAYELLTYSELSARFSSLRQAPLGDRRAPHKPLLIVLMLGRYQHRNFAAITFEEARAELSELLADFGPPSAGQPNALNPFWRLQNDKVWRVEDLEGERIAETVTPPNLGTLVDRKARGNFTDDIGTALREQPAYIGRLADEMLAAHFPRNLHDDICAAVGIDVGQSVEATPPVEVNRRDAEFRPRIIRAYEHRCAATGWDLRIGRTDAGLEAAHIKWHAVGGPSVETNGIALNTLHHKLFDLGAFTLSLDDRIPRILVSREVHGGDAARELLIGLHGKAMRPPQDLTWLPDRTFIEWHQKEVFKGEPRTLG